MANKALTKKLGIEPGYKSCFLNAPAEYLEQIGLDPAFHAQQQLRPKCYFIHFFAHSRAELEREFSRLKGALTLNGLLWVSWPKKSSGVETDLNDSIVRRVGLKAGLVDVKVASVDDTWSGMKFMYRLKERQSLP